MGRFDLANELLKKCWLSISKLTKVRYTEPITLLTANSQTTAKVAHSGTG